MLKISHTAILFLLFSTGAFAQLTFTATNTPSCSNDGTVTFNFTNGTPPYTIGYYDPITQNAVNIQGTVVNGLAPNYYYFYINDASGINGYHNTQITSVISYTLQITPETCGWSNGAINVTANNGTAPFAVVWQNHPPVLNLTNLPSGQYFGVLSDAAGCSVELGAFDSLNTSVIVPDSNTMTFQTVTTVSNCNNGTATITANNGLSPYAYNWNISPAQIGATATGLPPNVPINVVITDASGCIEDTTIYLNSTVNISITTNTTLETCLQSNGSATAGAMGGNAPYTYSWSTGASTTTINNLSQGYYSVQVIDANGCIGMSGAYVSRTTPILGNPTSTASSCTINNGTATVNPSGGTAPYTYLWNTVPAQTTQTATALAPQFSYYVLITDANGCTRSGYTIVSQSSTLSTTVNSTPEQCNLSNGTATVSVSGGVAPFTYLWSNGTTTASATGLQHGTYSVTVTDAASCVKTKNKLVGHVSPINVSVSTNNASCVFTADGSLTATASGGTAPYTYQWSNGATGATATGLLPGTYSVYVVDATGCDGGQSLISIGYATTLGCASIVSGNVYQDLNGNCLRDMNEPGLTNVWVCALPGGGCEQTDYNGNYSFLLAPGSYTINQQIPPAYMPACPAGSITLTTVAGTNYPGNDFADTSYFVVNHQVLKTNYTLPVTGNTYTQIITAKNLGSTNLPAQVVHKIDPGLIYVSSNPTPNAYNPVTNELTYSPVNVSPGYPTNIQIQLQVPTTMLLGSSLLCIDTISCSVPDDFPVNNWVNINETVVGPYDPNYISVNPRGIGAEGYILAGNPELEYEIHFQNTGSYPAQNVFVTDTIDTAVDIASFQFLASSHNCVVSVDANRLMTFSFPNINLPDSTSDQLGSNGFVRFKFNQESNLPVGTIITGTAAIYFDYNPPVITNMARNEIALPTGIEEKSFAFELRPNPATDVVRIQLADAANHEISITDVSGKVLLKTTAQKSLDLNLSSFPAGMYFVEVIGSNGRGVHKLMVTRD
jgi:hypothetical protein